MGDKTAQMKISFGMIFSIILIVIFIAFAFYAVKKFLNVSDEIKIAQFVDKLESDVDKVWKSTKDSQEVEYSLPKKIEKICFRDSDENLIFYPLGIVPPKKINHLDMPKIIKKENSFCVDNINGKIKLILKKDYGEALVVIQ